MTRPVWDRCTEDQRQVLVVLARTGWKNSRIAAELGITPLKVRNCLRRVSDKLGIRKRGGLAAAYLAECQEEKETCP